MISARYLNIRKNAVSHFRGLGTMGFGLPAAIGATSFRSTGTYRMRIYGSRWRTAKNIQELGTIMEQEGLVKIICLNTQLPGTSVQAMFNRRYSVYPPDVESGLYESGLGL